MWHPDVRYGANEARGTWSIFQRRDEVDCTLEQQEGSNDVHSVRAMSHPHKPVIPKRIKDSKIFAGWRTKVAK